MLEKLLLPILSLSLAVTSAAVQPNVIVIIADDLGYGDLSCYGMTAMETPNIDKLAASGQRFTSGYASASTCTPTRYSLLTGTYAFRHEGTGIAPPSGPLTIDPGMTTLPDLMKTAGYATAAIGKWHLGLGEKGKGPDWNGEITPGPLEIGFDYAFLLPTTNDRVPQVYLENHRILNLDPQDPLWIGNKKPSPDHPTGITHRSELKMDWASGHNGTVHNGISRIGFYTGGQAARFRDEDLADKWVEKANAWMEEKKDQPFFLYFASHDLHVPRMPHERFQGTTPLGYRGDSIAQLDWSVGELMKKVDELGISENTLFIFCSDNGPVMEDGYKDQALEKLGTHDANGPFRGGKYSIYEGGTRTPFITSWKGTIKPGVSDQLVSTVDFAASLASLTSTELPDDACVDSFDVMDAMLGVPDAPGRSAMIQQDNKGTDLGFREDYWKLQHHSSGEAGNVNVGSGERVGEVPEWQLFNLNKDPEERDNVIEANHDIAEGMKARLALIIKTNRHRP